MTCINEYERPEVSVIAFENEGVLAASQAQLEDIYIEEEQW